MGASKTDGAVEPDRGAIEGALASEGLNPHWWENGPNFVYSQHAHEYHKVLYCESGSIVFHVPDGDLELRPGDRLDVDPSTEHAATVGAEGVRCAEGHRT